MLKELKCAFCNKPLKLQTYESRLVVKDGYGEEVVGHITCWNKQGKKSPTPDPTSKSELDYQGKTIYVEYFDTNTELMKVLEKDKVPNLKYESVAYCDTYLDDRPDAWGKLYLLKELDVDSVAHECVHLASGIFDRQKRGSLQFTAGNASDAEEEFCALVGELTGLVCSEQIIPRTKLEKLLKEEPLTQSKSAQFPATKLDDIIVHQNQLRQQLKKELGI